VAYGLTMSKHKTKQRIASVRDLVILGVVAGTVVACGGKAAEMMGDVLDDAGRMMSDAGGRILGDAGHVLSDAGRGMRDGSRRMTTDADAQNANDGHTIIASEDSTRIEGGTHTLKSWKTAKTTVKFPSAGTIYFNYAKLVDGPLLLTDLRVETSEIVVYTVATGKPCYEITGDPDFNPIAGGPGTAPAVGLPAAIRPLFRESERFVGARVWIKSGETLCVSEGTGNASESTAYGTFVWSGFRPYE